MGLMIRMAGSAYRNSKVYEKISVEEENLGKYRLNLSSMIFKGLHFFGITFSFCGAYCDTLKWLKSKRIDISDGCVLGISQ